MYRILVAAVFTLLFLNISAQNNLDQPLLPENQFVRLSMPIKIASQEVSRQADLNQMTRQYFFSSYQVKKICEMLVSEEVRLAFAKRVYPKVTDKENFYMVYDAFGYFSTAIRLYDFINNQNVVAPELPEPVFPDYNHYTGSRNCGPVMAADDFTILFDQVNALQGDRARMQYAVSVVRNNCMAVKFLMKLSLLLDSESLRLDLIKESESQLFDLMNIEMAGQVFLKPEMKRSFQQYIGSIRPVHGFDPLPPAGGHVVCVVADADFDAMIASLKKQSFENTRISLARQMLVSGRCFTVAQVIEVIKVFSFEESKLDLSRFAWEFCSQKEKYYLVADCFEYAASKEELLKFLSQK